MERERQRLAIEERKAEEQRLLLEEQAKERIRNEKRAAKERRRNEARAKEDLRRQQDLMKMSSSVDRESVNGQGINNGSGNSAHQYNDYQANKGKTGIKLYEWCVDVLPKLSFIDIKSSNHNINK